MTPDDIPQPPKPPEDIEYQPPTKPPTRRGPGRPKKAKAEAAPAPTAVPATLPSDTGTLQRMIATQQEQITELMKLVNSGGNPAGVDLSKTPQQREEAAAHAKIRKNRTRDPERDANPNLVWIQETGGYGHYQQRPFIPGHVPLDLVKELKTQASVHPLVQPGPIVNKR